MDQQNKTKQNKTRAVSDNLKTTYTALVSDVPIIQKQIYIEELNTSVEDKILKFDLNAIEKNEYIHTLKKVVKEMSFTPGDKEEIIRKNIEEYIKFILTSSNIYIGNPIKLIKMFSSERNTKISNREIGFIDSDFKNVIIEYKRYEKLDKRSNLLEAKNQLFDYMKSSEMKKYPLVHGFLTDGKSLYSFKKEENIIEEIEDFSGLINETIIDYVIRCLINYDKKDITPFSLKEDFSILSKSPNNACKDLFLELFNIKTNSISGRTKLLFKEWEKLFKLSESDESKSEEIKKRRKALSDLIGRDIIDTKDEYDIIFALHTVYSLIIKLIAIKTAKESSYSLHIDFAEIALKDNNEIKKFLTNVETGNIYKKMNIVNMIEGDFFSWYIKETLPNSFYNSFKSICFKLSKYENFATKILYQTQDFFRELYENCIPPEIRHSFGEYYTPYWLADGVISDFINRNNIKDYYKSLDPTCGSGTFVMVNIDKTISFIQKNHNDLSNKEKLQIIINNCYGIDLNPLAVLSSKINYFMNIANVYDSSYEIEIPIYLGDSSYMPEKVVLDGVECITYDFFTDIEEDKNYIHFCLPIELIKDKNFISYMDNLEIIITNKQNLKTKIKKAENYIINCINPNFINEQVKLEIRELIYKLVDLEEKKLNSIWLRIFANYLKSSVISNVDLISGNPPWVDWKNLPAGYQNKLKTFCKDNGIFSNDKNCGGISLNICALIAMKCISKYAKNDGGELSFLMPTSILFNKSFEGFRNFKVNGRKYYFNKICNWHKAGKPFNPVAIDFCSFTFSNKHQDYENGIDYIEYKAKKNVDLTNTHALFKTEKEKLNKVEKKAYMLDSKSNNPFMILDEPIDFKNISGTKEYTFRKGLGLKAEVHKLIYVREHDEDETLAIFNNFELRGKYKYVSQNEIVLEKKYVRPLIETPSLSPYILNFENLYTTFPYEWGNKKPIPFNELEEKAPYLAKYLKDNKNILDNQSDYNKRIQNTDEFYGIIRTGDYLFRDNFACMKDNGSVLCTPITKVQTHWGELVSPVFDGHISYISENKNKPISYDEMFFIVGIMNCPQVKKFIESSSSEQSIGTKFDIKLPYYDETNIKHKQISTKAKELSILYVEKETSEKAVNTINTKITEITNDLERIYLSL